MEDQPDRRRQVDRGAAEARPIPHDVPCAETSCDEMDEALLPGEIAMKGSPVASSVVIWENDFPSTRS
jgi:hypothetical protein